MAPWRTGQFSAITAFKISIHVTFYLSRTIIGRTILSAISHYDVKVSDNEDNGPADYISYDKNATGIDLLKQGGKNMKTPRVS